jgi:predicted ATPase
MRIVLSGPDGSGKSSLVKGLSLHFMQAGPVHVSWRRFGFVFARAFNLLARQVGWSYYEQSSAGPVGYHDYKRPWSFLYILLVWIDCVIIIIPKWWMRDLFGSKETVIIDRFLFDIVADLILSTHRPRAALRLFDTILKRHRSRGKCVFLVCASETVYQRRPDVIWDKSYPEKVRTYTLLRRLYSVPSLRTDRLSPEESIKKVIQLCES